MPRLVFMGSDSIAIPGLDWLWDRGRDIAELVAVYTQPDRPSGRGQKLRPNAIKQWAIERNLPVLQPEKLTPERLDEFVAFQADAALVMAYGHILKKTWIDAPTSGVWNLHVSLLPRLRGASPIQGAIAQGDAESGICLMRMVAALDAGPVLDLERVAIDRLETGASLEKKLAEACVPLLQRRLVQIFQSDAPLEEQDESRATYTRKLRKEDGCLDFGVPADALARRINALNPWPGAFFDLAGETIRVGCADFDLEESFGAAPPGIVLRSGTDSLVVTTSTGVVKMLRLQRPGGRMLEAADFLRGHPVETGFMIPSLPMPELVAPRPFKG